MTQRQRKLDSLDQNWDVVVIGGGINGAGVFSLAAAQGLRVLLLEQRDFGWGTSSRSGKLVHGGLRYMLQGQPRTTWHSVHERQRLLGRYKGLVKELGFLFPLKKSMRLAKPAVHLVLSSYDLMAGRMDYRFHGQGGFAMLAPRVRRESLCGGFAFTDATADDARLVLRVLQGGVDQGGTALNYVSVRSLIRRGPTVRGVVAQDQLSGQTHQIRARVVINASGAWTDDVRAHLGQPGRLRRLRGSHLVLPRWRLPLSQAVGLRHPADGRNMYVMPWEGATLVGTTDIDHHGDMYGEPAISPQEGEYLLEALNHWFPGSGIGRRDVMATFSGVRPVIDTGKKDPSKESRDHAVWSEDGMVTMTGGKLTTFSLVAAQGLEAARKWLELSVRDETPAMEQGGQADEAGRQDCQAPEADFDEPVRARLAGRHGRRRAGRLLGEAMPSHPGVIEGTSFLWAELAWAAANEQAERLEDILLRRTRLGLLLPRGGQDHMPRIRRCVQRAAGWDDQRWQEEERAYAALWSSAYSPSLLSC